MTVSKKDCSILEGLVVLEYLDLGIMPFYPASPDITTVDKKARRKFRKIWRKVAKGTNQLERLRGSGIRPTNSQLYIRKKMVHRWIKFKVKQKYNIP
tara:strand:+ start:116 stop:406 length:291 start_codon:yes stop_codon:yes gene_type:complete